MGVVFCSVFCLPSVVDEVSEAVSLNRALSSRLPFSGIWHIDISFRSPACLYPQYWVTGTHTLGQRNTQYWVTGMHSHAGS